MAPPGPNKRIGERERVEKNENRLLTTDEWLRRGRTKELEKEKEWKRMKIAS
jgi:hypothetical protein